MFLCNRGRGVFHTGKTWHWSLGGVMRKRVCILKKYFLWEQIEGAGSFRGNLIASWVLAFCSVPCALPHYVVSSSPVLKYGISSLAAGAGIHPQVVLQSEPLVSGSVSPVRGDKNKSAPLCQNLWSLSRFPFFFHCTIAWGLCRWPHCSFQSNPRLAGSSEATSASFLTSKRSRAWACMKEIRHSVLNHFFFSFFLYF